jgi:hypothetical protein
VKWIGISQSKYFDWKKRYGKVNEHNGSIPRDFWMEDWEKRAILDFHHANPLEGYRRLTFMMLDADVVALSPSSVYRVLREAGVMDRFNGKKSKKGTGFGQPSKPHDHWHVDVSYLNIGGTFYFMCSVLARLLSQHRSLGNTREDGRGRSRSDPSAGKGKVPRCEAPDHHRQWAAVHFA